MKPLGNRILVLPIVEKKSSIIDIENTETPQFAKVVDVSESLTCPILVGDTVFFRPYMGVEIAINGVMHLYLDISDVVAYQSQP